MKIKLICFVVALAFSCTAVRAADALTEKDFAKLMKEIGKSSKDFKNNVQAKNAAVVEKDAARAAEIYTQMAGFWKARKAEHAVEWSEASAKAASATAVAAKAGDWEKVKTSWGVVGQNCKTCHEAHREKLDDGSYKIKN